MVSLGKEIYQRNIRPKLGPEHRGKFVVIDVKTGDYVINDNEMAADSELRKIRPDAFTWTERVGLRSAGCWEWAAPDGFIATTHDRRQHRSGWPGWQPPSLRADMGAAGSIKLARRLKFRL